MHRKVGRQVRTLQATREALQGAAFHAVELEHPMQRISDAPRHPSGSQPWFEAKLLLEEIKGRGWELVDTSCRGQLQYTGGVTARCSGILTRLGLRYRCSTAYLYWFVVEVYFQPLVLTAF